ncbi:MAG: hypothetical protein AAGA30_15065, partial [Planctomycetota bacterium]
MYRWFYTTGVFSFALTVLCCSGCKQDQMDPVAEEVPNIPKPISVAFLGGGDVAEEVARQWKAIQGGEITCTVIEPNKIDESYDAIANQDIIIYPPSLLGKLVSDEVITPIPPEVWDSKLLDNRGLLRDHRMTFIRFGGERWATPISSPNLFLMSRNDAIRMIGNRSIRDWDDLIEVTNQIRLIEAKDDSPPPKVVVPMARPFCADIFFAISAANVRHRGKLNFIFDRNDMTPLLASPPYVNALNQLKKLARSSNQDTPETAYRKLLAGKASLVITWPSKAFVSEDLPETSEELTNQLMLTRLPGHRNWYDFSSREFRENPEDNRLARVEHIGFVGLQASILKSAAYPTTAFEFLSWISSKKVCSNIFSNSIDGGPSRQSHLGDPQNWTGEFLNIQNSNAYADSLTEINESPVFFMFPRILGQREYKRVLADAIIR